MRQFISSILLLTVIGGGGTHAYFAHREGRTDDAIDWAKAQLGMQADAPRTRQDVVKQFGAPSVATSSLTRWEFVDRVVHFEGDAVKAIVEKRPVTVENDAQDTVRSQTEDQAGYHMPRGVIQSNSRSRLAGAVGRQANRGRIYVTPRRSGGRYASGDDYLRSIDPRSSTGRTLRAARPTLHRGGSVNHRNTVRGPTQWWR